MFASRRDARPHGGCDCDPCRGRAGRALRIPAVSAFASTAGNVLHPSRMQGFVIWRNYTTNVFQCGTMNITVTCVGCGQKLSAPANLAGRRVACPKCKAPVDVVPARQPAAAPVAPAAEKNQTSGEPSSGWDDLLPPTPADS